jgi:hypothetical protein
MRVLIILLLMINTSQAKDIYVEQAPANPATPTEQNKPAFIEKKPRPAEKDLISNTPPREYCSVISGCR